MVHLSEELLASAAEQASRLLSPPFCGGMRRQMKIMRNKVKQPLDRRFVSSLDGKATEPPVDGGCIATEKEPYLSMRLIASLQT
jgi:hypothetical protein